MINIKWDAEQKFFLWIGISFLLLVVIVYLSYVTASRLIIYDNRVKGSNEILLRLEEIFSNIKHMETNIRNYVITGRASYLSKQVRHTATVHEDLTHVRELLPDDSDLVQKLNVLESLISERFDLFDETTDLRKNSGFEAAQQFIMTDKGENVSNKIREVINEIETEENKLLEILLNGKKDARNMVYVTAFGILIAIIFGSVSVVTINRHIRERNLLYENSQKQAEELRILYEDQSRRSSELEIINNLSEVIHKSLNLEDVYRVALDAVMGFENVDIAMIYLVQEDSNEVVLVAHRNVPESYLNKATRIPYSEGIIWNLIETGESSYMEDAQHDPRLEFGRRELPFESALGIPVFPVGKSIVGVPVFHEGKAIGVVRLLSNKKNAFNERELSLLSTLCNQLGVAVAQATIFNALKDAHEKLKQIDTMKDEFISIASHELRTPLGAIGGYLDMLLEGDFGVLPPKVMFAVTEVNKASKRLMDLVNSMLDISRIEQGRLEIHNSNFDLCDLYHEVVGSLEPVARIKGIRLEYRPPTGSEKPFVLADKDRVQQILINLVGNAVKFTETGEVIITYRVDNRKIVTDVIDTGVGVPNEARVHLFQKFWKGRKALTRRLQEGAGLGLYISHLLVNEMGGDIWLERSEPGKGSTFSFSLPRLESIIV